VQPEESKKELRTRKYSDPKYDNEEYMTSIEQSLLKSLGLSSDVDSAKRLDSRPDSKKATDKPKGVKVPRKYSDNKYDKPEFEARIEQQTIRAVEALIKEPVLAKKEEAKKEKKNLFGLAFDIPLELQQIIEKEMQQADKGMI
jgi:hypothetical protein